MCSISHACHRHCCCSKVTALLQVLPALLFPPTLHSCKPAWLPGWLVCDMLTPTVSGARIGLFCTACVFLQALKAEFAPLEGYDASKLPYPKHHLPGAKLKGFPMKPWALLQSK